MHCDFGSRCCSTGAAEHCRTGGTVSTAKGRVESTVASSSCCQAAPAYGKRVVVCFHCSKEANRPQLCTMGEGLCAGLTSIFAAAKPEELWFVCVCCRQGLYWSLISIVLLAGASSSIGSLGAAIAVEREYAKTLCGDDSTALRKLNAGGGRPLCGITAEGCTVHLVLLGAVVSSEETAKVPSHANQFAYAASRNISTL